MQSNYQTQTSSDFLFSYNIMQTLPKWRFLKQNAFETLEQVLSVYLFENTIFSICFLWYTGGISKYRVQIIAAYLESCQDILIGTPKLTSILTSTLKHGKSCAYGKGLYKGWEDNFKIMYHPCHLFIYSKSHAEVGRIW